MANKYGISKGCLLTIMRGGDFENPIVQVLGCKKINVNSNTDKERHRLLISDCAHTISYAMITTSCNDAAAAEALKTFSVIKLTKYITTTLNNTGKDDHRVMLIMNYELLAAGETVGEKLGSPAPLTDADINSTATVARSSSSTSSFTSNNVSVARPNLATVNGGNRDNGEINLANQNIIPIDSLTPYQNRWVIKARVTSKSQIRSWSNSKGEGTLFNFNLCDESGEIRAAAFRDAVDKFYDYIQVDKVYYISKCQLKLANKQFNNLKNDYEMTLNVDSIIQECLDTDADSVPKIKYDFVGIDKITGVEQNTVIDVIGVVKSVGELQTFQSRNTGKELKKRDVVVVDQTLNAVTLTLWGNEAETFEALDNPVIAMKGVRVAEYAGGKNLSVVFGSTIKLNPEISECYRLRSWYDEQGSKMNVSNISAQTGSGSFNCPWVSFEDVREQNLGNSEKGYYFQLMGTILLIRSENAIYKACPTPECNKKIVDLENGMYRCEKCNREFPNFKYRLLGNMNIGDSSGNQWVSVFNSEMEKILEMTADEVGKEGENNPEGINDVMNKAHFKQYIFKFRTKMETFNDESRLKTVCVRVEPINYENYNSHLIDEIEKMMV